MKLKPMQYAASILFAGSAAAAPVHFQTNAPDGLMAMVSQPLDATLVENEVADDFTLQAPTRLTRASFTGLVPNSAGPGPNNVERVAVEIYRVFPLDSTVPASGAVPNRNNSPSDVAFATRDSSLPSLTFTTTQINPAFTAAASIVDNLRPAAGSAGPVNGTEVQIDVVFDEPIVLPAGHYFFVPQVTLDTNNFYWLSAPKPIVAPGTPIVAPFTDLQAWVRDNSLAPDWLRAGTDIIGGAPAPTFNAAFALDGVEDTVHFATNDSDDRMAMGTVTQNDVEAADDFVLADATQITHATFTGLLAPTGAPGTIPNVDDVEIEIYRVFPFDSDTTRVIGVPARGNSPADNVFDARDSGAVNDGVAEVTVAFTVLADPVTVASSVLDHLQPAAGSDGAVTGQKVLFDVTFDPPITLAAGHYFFKPAVASNNSVFYWLSSPRPITSPGTPIVGATDLQAWIRDDLLAPDWLRVGTDLIGGATPPTFNATFSLDGIREQIFHDGFQ